ncbi:hypothetical protein MHYP_G00149160 [Metynnis hypsauchen]
MTSHSLHSLQKATLGGSPGGAEFTPSHVRRDKHFRPRRGTSVLPDERQFKGVKENDNFAPFHHESPEAGQTRGNHPRAGGTAL